MKEPSYFAVADAFLIIKMSVHDHDSIVPILYYTNRAPPPQYCLPTFIGRRPRPEGRRGGETEKGGVKIPLIRISRRKRVFSRESPTEGETYSGRSHSVIAEQSKNMYVSDDVSEQCLLLLLHLV